MLRPLDTRTFLSRMARRILASRPISQLSRITESSTSAPLSTRTQRLSTEFRTVPPARMQPPETMESMAWPRRDPPAQVDLAGGRRHVPAPPGPHHVVRGQRGGAARVAGLACQVQHLGAP